MRCTWLVSLLLVSTAAAAAASPARPVLSVDAGPAVALDGRLGATAEARGAAEWSLSDRVSLGGGVLGSVAGWADVGDENSGDVLGLGAFVHVHVLVRLAEGIALEPAAGGGVMHLRGDALRSTLPAYGSSVAIVLGHMRLGVSSRVTVGDTDGFSPDTQLTAFIGWRS